ncbi:MAG: hypothetical protein HY927_00040 [Elusimicrobia bacterium]|nr:hypothetical protein [Elusimicrobiota bacterium]
MKCALCSMEFDEALARNSCQGCPLASGECRMARCPRCRYETPLPPPWLGRLRRLLGGEP